MFPRQGRGWPVAATEFAPDTLWLHAEQTCQLSGVNRAQLEGFFEWFGEGHMDEHPMVKGHLHEFELGQVGKLQLCFSASTAFAPARLPGGFMLSRAAYQTTRKLLFGVEESLRSHDWGPWQVTSTMATVWASGTDTVIMTVDYTPDLGIDQFESDQYPSALRVGYGCRSMAWV